MFEPIVYVDTSEIREGKLAELKTAIEDLVKFVDANERQAIAYNVYFSEDGTRMTVVQIHRDSDSLEFHMKVAGPAFPRFTELVKLITIEIFGRPSDSLLDQLREKARMLGNGTVVVHELHAGFARFGEL